MKSSAVSRIISVAGAILCALLLTASPARRTSLVLRQPDGTAFNAILRGDEFSKMLTTSDGCAIIQDEEGWYCYATFLPDGRKADSGYKVGQTLPPDIAAASRDIPYGKICETAAVIRKSIMPERRNLMQRLNALKSPAIKSEEQVIEKHGLVLLVQFSDLAFTYGKEDFIALLNEGRNGMKGAVGYFNDQFRGAYEFSFDVSDIITLPKSYKYYGRNLEDRNGSDANPAEMVRDACILAEGSIDFSRYDDDKDGVADNVFIFYAGPDEADGAGDYHIWSHAWFIGQGAGISLVLDGVTIDRYACTSELSQDRMAGIGTFCHEYSHTFGLPDMYDTDLMGSGGLSDALWGSTSIMDKGNKNNFGDTPPNFNAVEREMLGISEAVVIDGDGTYELPSVEKGIFYRINGDTPDEYYLFECRNNKGWDAYIGGEGMLIYHVDKSLNDSGNGLTAAERWSVGTNAVNSNPQHQCADLIEASRPADGSGTGDNVPLQPIFYPYGEKDSFSPDTDPAFAFWNGTTSSYEISGITRNGEKIRFNARRSDSSKIPVPIVTQTDIFQDAAIVSWCTDISFEGEMLMRWGKKGSTMTEIQVESCGTENNVMNYAAVLEGLSPKTEYVVQIFCKEDDTEGSPAESGFTTKATMSGGRPFMYLRYVERNNDGTFPSGARLPLRLFNAAGADNISWTLDGKEIRTGDNGYYIPETSGLLKAVITYKDGTKDIVAKEIIIREDEE